MTADHRGYDYEYDYENRLLKITKSGGNEDVAQYAYDALGRRIQKVEYDNGIAVTTTRYYHDNNWQVLAETDGNGNMQRSYIYGNGIDQALMMIKNNYARYYYASDQLGSPICLIDSSGNAVERYDYTSYGKVTIYNGNYNNPPREHSSCGNTVLFTGRTVDFLDDDSLKIQYNRNRYYDSGMGRWLTQDPLGYVDSMNLYEYAVSIPMILIDPFGLKVKFKINSPELLDSLKFDSFGYAKLDVDKFFKTIPPQFTTKKYGKLYKAKIKREREWNVVFSWGYVKPGVIYESKYGETIVSTSFSKATKQHEQGHIRINKHWYKKYLDDGYSEVAKAIKPCDCSKLEAQKKAIQIEEKNWRQIEMLAFDEGRPDHVALDNFDINTHGYYQENGKWYVQDLKGAKSRRETQIKSSLKRSPVKWIELEIIVDQLKKESDRSCGKAKK